MKNETAVIRTGLGQKSHRFLPPESTKPCVIAGVIFDDVPGFQSKSDGDVVYHALCNAITSITGISILSDIAVQLCSRDGITDSEVYLREACKTLKNIKISHVALAIEAKRPRIQEHIPEMKKKVAKALSIQPNQIGITCTTGAGLSDAGCGDGVMCTAIITTIESSPPTTLF